MILLVLFRSSVFRLSSWLIFLKIEVKCLLQHIICVLKVHYSHKMENVEDFDAIQKRLRDEIAPFKAFARGASAKKD